MSILPNSNFSYQDQNIEMSNEFKRYDRRVPQYLWNRPRPFVIHCLSKIQEASQARITSIRHSGMSTFTVCSFTIPNKTYKVFFGNEGEMPSCSCDNFLATGYLCKHFFAVMQNVKDWQWEMITPLYRDSPFLNMDTLGASQRQIQSRQDHVPIEPELRSTIEDAEVAETDHVDVETEDVSKRKLLKECNELLDEMKKLTFIAKDSPDALQELHNNLSIARKALAGNLPSNVGMVLHKQKDA